VLRPPPVERQIMIYTNVAEPATCSGSLRPYQGDPWRARIYLREFLKVQEPKPTPLTKHHSLGIFRRRIAVQVNTAISPE